MLEKLQKLTLRGYLIIIIIFDVVCISLSFYGQLGLHTLFHREAVYQKFSLAELGLLGMLTTTDIMALPAVIPRNRQKAKAWRSLLLPRVIANLCAISLRCGHVIYTVILSQHKRDKYHVVGSLLPYVAWHSMSAVVTYLYFRNVALTNATKVTTGDEEKDEIKTVTIINNPIQVAASCEQDRCLNLSCCEECHKIKSVTILRGIIDNTDI